MRLFRKKSDSSDHQEYLDGLITSIRKARREEEEKAGLHAFVEDDDFPVGDAPGPPRVPPGVAGPGGSGGQPPENEAEEIANLEAYLSTLEAAEAASADDDEQDSQAI